MSGSGAPAAPLPIIPGPEGRDSPAVADGIPRFRWYAWIDLADDRRAARRSPWPTVEWAIGYGAARAWPLWWLYYDARAWQVHVAQLAPVDGGGTMLLAACGRSAPWTGALNYSVAPRADTNPAGNWDRCQVCGRVT